jgi:PAS domain S-box-containing protein
LSPPHFNPSSVPAGGSARALAAVLAALGSLALLTTLLPWWLGWQEQANVYRGAVGTLLLGFAAGVQGLRRAGHPRLGALLALVAMLLTAAAYSAHSGLGLHSVVQAAGVLIIVLAGVYVGAGAATVLGALAIALLLALAAAERLGGLPGLGMAWSFTLERLLTLLVLLVGATLTAVLLAGLLARSIAAAQEGERRFRELLELGADWYWELDPRGRIVDISPTFEARSGRRVAEFLQTQQPGGPQIRDDAEYRAVLDTMRRREPHRNRLLTWQCTDGTELVVASSGEPRFDGDGRFAGWRGTGRNVTAEVATQRALQVAQREMEAVFDNAAVGIALSQGGRVLRVNARWAEFLGLPRESQVGRSLREVAPDEATYERLRRRQQECAARGEGLDVEIRVPRPGGAARLLRLRTHPIDPAHPLSGGTAWTAEDVTEQRRIERELAAASGAAQAASRAKSAFLATMSHEIRTPLNGVVGLAQMLQLPDLPPARHAEYLSHLLDSARQLHGIVSDVLDLSKIEAGRLELEDAEFDLPAMLRSVFETFVPLAREKGLAIALDVDAALPARVRGDALRLRQILANYLSNAIKFTATGQVRLAARRVAGGRLRVEVEDSGIGVPPELHARLFRPFEQADGSTTRRFGGSGLGLSICAELARRMGGDVGLEPGPGGRGSRFWATVPMPEVPAQTAAGASATGASPAGPVSAPGAPLVTPPPLAGRRVLVAEDNPVNMIIVVALLERLGAEVLQAEDGAQAVALLEQRQSERGRLDLDVVLMDLHMPEMNGWEAARAIRSRPWGATLPIVACSADVLDSARHEAAAAGMNGLLGKPLEESALRRLFDSLADAGGPGASSNLGAADPRSQHTPTSPPGTTSSAA